MKILILITGSIAAHKVPSIVSALSTHFYHDIEIMTTENALKFVTKDSLMYTAKKWWNDEYMAHIACQVADKLVVLPATANIIGKIATGIADDEVSTTCLKRNLHLEKMLFPAMNPDMWKSSVVQRNIEILLNDGWIVVEPTCGITACGEFGYGTLPKIDHIVRAINNLKTKRNIEIKEGISDSKWYKKYEGEIFPVLYIKREFNPATKVVSNIIWVDPYDSRLEGNFGSSFQVCFDDCKIINLENRVMA